MNHSADKPLKVLLTAIVLAVPAVLAVHLAQAVSLPLRLSAGAPSTVAQGQGPAGAARDPVAGLMRVAAAGPRGSKSLVTGVLYTRGKAMIDWNGTKIPLENGSYAYLGGETIQLAPDAIGLLKLADGGSVTLCPGATARLQRTPAGDYSLSLMSGGSRFRFRADKAFEIKVNDVVMSRAEEAAGSDAFVSAEVHAKQKSGCIICGLKSKLKVSTAADRQPQGESAPGAIVDVSTDTASQTAKLEKTPIPGEILSGLMQSSAGAGKGNAYLCRCQEIQRYARNLATARSAIAEAQAREAKAAAEALALKAREAARQALAEAQAPPPTPLPEPEVAAAPPVPVPEPAPPVAPPEAPPLALAQPGPPDPFDPNVLPPPAAGEADEPILVVAPPVVPVAGSGGGLDASPS